MSTPDFLAVAQELYALRTARGICERYLKAHECSAIDDLTAAISDCEQLFESLSGERDLHPDLVEVSLCISPADGKILVNIDTSDLEEISPCGSDGPTSLRVVLNDAYEKPLWNGPLAPGLNNQQPLEKRTDT